MYGHPHSGPETDNDIIYIRVGNRQAEPASLFDLYAGRA